MAQTSTARILEGHEAGRLYSNVNTSHSPKQQIQFSLLTNILPLVWGFLCTYSSTRSLYPRASFSGITPCTTTTPLFLISSLTLLSNPLSRSANSTWGITPVPFLAMISFSSRSVRNNLFQLAMMSFSRSLTRSNFSRLKRSGSGACSAPDSETKESEISPVLFVAGFDVCTVARQRCRRGKTGQAFLKLERSILYIYICVRDGGAQYKKVTDFFLRYSCENSQQQNKDATTHDELKKLI